MKRKTFKIPEGQALLPFRQKNGGILASASSWERRGFAVIILLFTLSSGSYIYFLAASVAHVSAREELAQKTRLLSAETAKLEAAYLARSLEMTEPYAKAQGLVHSGEQAFVEKAESFTVNQTR